MRHFRPNTDDEGLADLCRCSGVYSTDATPRSDPLCVTNEHSPGTLNCALEAGGRRYALTLI